MFFIKTKTPGIEKIDWHFRRLTIPCAHDGRNPVKSQPEPSVTPQAAGVGRPNTRGRKTMTTKPYQTTVEPMHHDRRTIAPF